MSLLSKYIERKIKKHGLKNVVMNVLMLAAKVTPSKKDDRMVAEMKKVLDRF